MIHTVKGFSIVNEAEELFWNSLAFSMGLPGSSDGKESACNVEDLGLIPVDDIAAQHFPCHLFLMHLLIIFPLLPKNIKAHSHQT